MSDTSTPDGVCSRHGLPIETTICPFAEEIHGVAEECVSCCPECTNDCALDV